MVDEEFWKPAGISKILDYQGSAKITVPDRLYKEENILEKGDQVRWYINSVTDTVLVTKNHLSEDEYVSVASNSFADNENSRTTVPAKLFEDYDGQGGHGVKPEIASNINWDREGWLYFMFHSGMNEGVKQTCYVFTEEEFDNRFSGEGLKGIPRFT